MGMCLSVFLRHAEIKNVRIKNKAFFRYFKVIDLVMFFCIKDMFIVSGQPFSQMHIIAVTAQTFPVVQRNFYSSFFYFFKNSFIRKNHFIIFMYLAELLLFNFRWVALFNACPVPEHFSVTA